MNLSYKALMISICLVLSYAFSAFAGGLPKPVSKNQEAQELIDQAWALERTGFTADIFKECLELLEKANQLDPNNYTILTDLARYYWNYGDNLPKQTKEQQEKLVGIYKKGMSYAEDSLKLKETAGGHYWLAANLAASREFSSILAQAGAFPAIYKHANQVEELEPDYFYGASEVLWAEIISRIPKVVVKMVGGNPQEVVDGLNQNIKKWPNFFPTYIFKARFIYTYYGDKEESLSLLDYVIKQSPEIFSEEAHFNRDAQNDAQELWKKITGKDYPQR